MPPRPKAPAQQPSKSKPWAAPAPTSRPTLGGSDRKLIHEGRILGTAQEWNNSWGWIVPSQKITHPQFRSKLYCHRKDVKVPGGALIPGMTVDFLLYSDSRGLGAGDVREAEPGVAGTFHGVAEAAVTNGEDDSLPHGWEKVWSEEHGEYYYWNKSTKEASWVPPEVDEAVEGEEPLPEGWSMNFDPENNEYYYWHAPTKTTTWERPKAPAKEAAPEEGEEEPAQEAEPEVRPAVEGPVLGQQRVKGRVEKWQGFFGWIAPMEELGEDLKPLLENRQDRIYVNWRDVTEGTTIKAGSMVDFMLYADDNGLGASDVRLQKDTAKEKEETKKAVVQPTRGTKRPPPPPKDAMAELERQWAEQDAKLAAALGDSAEAEAAAEPASEGVVDAVEMEDAPLLPGWEQHWSEEHSCFYYWHKAAKQASWERPCVPMGPGERREDKVWEGEGAEEGAARLATPITPVASWAGKEITPLTPATAADKEKAKLATKQPSAGFRAAQASGAFLGRGWRGQEEAAKPATGGAKGGVAPARAAPKPAIAKQPGTQKGATPVQGKGGGRNAAWVPSGPAAKRPRAQ